VNVSRPLADGAQVGAQHLYCVSMRGYPQSIITEVATRHGPTVRLLTLNEVQSAELPSLVAAGMFYVRHETISLAGVGTLVLNSTPSVESLPFDPESKIFRSGHDPQRLSLNEVLARMSHRISAAFRDQPGALEVESVTLEVVIRSGWGNDALRIHWGAEEFVVLRLPVTFTLKVVKTAVPFTTYAYEAQNVDGVLAWVGTARGTVEGHDFEVHFTYKPRPDGRLEVAATRQDGLDGTGLVFYRDRSSGVPVVAHAEPQ
jgi:hypothetical protein